MDYTKQLIKAITDLTKAVNKNTESIKGNTKLSEVQIDYVESSDNDEDILLSPDEMNKWYTWNDNVSCGYKQEPLNVVIGKISE